MNEKDLSGSVNKVLFITECIRPTIGLVNIKNYFI